MIGYSISYPEKLCNYDRRIFLWKMKKSRAESPGFGISLLFYDFQNFHGARLHANTAGDTLGDGILALVNHNLHGANLYALAAADASFLVDHVNAGLGILGNSIMLTSLHALTALNAHIGLCTGTLCNNLNGRVIRMKFLIKSLGAGTHTL